MAQNSIVDFIRRLEEDDALRAAFKANPRQVAEQFGLTGDDLDAVASRDEHRIRAQMTRHVQTMAIVMG